MSNFKGGDAAINRKGRPPGTSKKISALKSVFNKLKAISTKAIENVEKSVNGETVDKEVLASSKWVVGTLQSYNKAILAEEEGLKLPSDPVEDDKDLVVEEPSRGFSLKMIK